MHLQATAVKRFGCQVGGQRSAVPDLIRSTAAHASGNPKPRRGGMFIANDVHKNVSQPCRGGMRLRRTIHAAPMGLGTIIGLDGCYKPVSYTHLRAHETRHDLVCRLLLEKKKKTKDDSNTKSTSHKKKESIKKQSKKT